MVIAFVSLIGILIASLLAITFRSNAKSSTSALKYFVILGIIMLLGAGLYYSGIFKARCSISLTPDELVSINPNNENAVAALFHDKGFKRIEAKDNYEEEVKFDYSYIKSEEGFSSRLANRIEWGYINLMDTDVFFYVIRDHKKYKSYFIYLKTLGADSLLPQNYSDYSLRLQNWPAYKYKNHVVVDMDYNPELEGYRIGVCNWDSLGLTPVTK